MSGRFRPTSFRVAFGNVPEDNVQQPPPPEEVSVQQVQVREEQSVERIQIEQQQAEGFERLVVREMPCNVCHCYRCSYRRRTKDLKLNVIIFLLVVIMLILIIHVGGK